MRLIYCYTGVQYIMQIKNYEGGEIMREKNADR